MPRRLAGGPHGLTRAEVTDSQRSRALQALVEIVGERGFAEAKVADVLDRAGISRKTFYELFATKEECLFAVFDDVAQCVRGSVRTAMERGVTPRERLDAITDSVLEWVDAEPELARLCLVEVPSTGVAGQRRLTAILSWLSSAIADVLGDLDVPDVLPELLVGGVHQMVLNRIVADGGAHVAALAPDLSDVWADLERRAA